MDWYVDTFASSPSSAASIATTANAPGMNLSFQTSRTPTRPTKGRAIDHIGFEVKNLEAYCKKLEAQGRQVRRAVSRRAGDRLEVAFLTDPEGTYIELTEGFSQY